MIRSTFSIALLTAAALSGCSSESPSSTPVSGPPRDLASGNLPPVIRTAWIEPNPLVLNQPIRVVVDAHDPEGRPLDLEQQWFVNEKPLQGAMGYSLEPDQLRPGDRVSVEVIPWDEKGPGEPYRTAALTVVNTPPRIKSIRYHPFPPRVGDQLTATVEAEDAEGDDITYTYVWTRNEELVSEGEEANSLNLAGFRRGDQIRLEVTPQDGDGPGESLQSETIEIANASPEITSVPPVRIQGAQYEYRVTATDRDGDALVYHLESGPDGMIIDPATGRLRWTLTASTKGTFSVRVSVSDGQDGEPTVQEFDLTIGGQGAEETKDTRESRSPQDRSTRAAA